MAKSEKTGWDRAYQLAGRLEIEKKADFDAYLDIVHYRGEIRKSKDIARDLWSHRHDLVDGGCRQFWVRGLLDYQRMSFSEIFTREKDGHWTNSKHTLQRRLDLLISQGFAERDPPDGGPGRRGKYMFVQPSEMLGKDGVPFDRVVDGIKRYVDSGTSREEKAEKIADVLESLMIGFGYELAIVLGRMAKARKYLRETDLFRTMNNESYEIDIHIDFTAMRILLKEYPDLAEDALSVFWRRLHHAVPR